MISKKNPSIAWGLTSQPNSKPCLGFLGLVKAHNAWNALAQ
jgi:hypothetical protein